MALDIYAKKIPGIEIGRMDLTTLLAFMNIGGNGMLVDNLDGD